MEQLVLELKGLGTLLQFLSFGMKITKVSVSYQEGLIPSGNIYSRTQQNYAVRYVINNVTFIVKNNCWQLKQQINSSSFLQVKAQTLLWHCFCVLFSFFACFASTLSLCSAAVCEPFCCLLPGLVLYNSFFILHTKWSRPMTDALTLYFIFTTPAAGCVRISALAWKLVGQNRKDLVCLGGEQGFFELHFVCDDGLRQISSLLFIECDNKLATSSTFETQKRVPFSL